MIKRFWTIILIVLFCNIVLAVSSTVSSIGTVTSTDDSNISTAIANSQNSKGVSNIVGYTHS